MQHNSLSISLLLQKLDGKEYDFVFEIEIEEGKKAKLGVNKNDNPYMLASNFIDDHDLNPDYLETIVGWLDEQMDKVGAKGWVAEGSRPLALPAPMSCAAPARSPCLVCFCFFACERTGAATSQPGGYGHARHIPTRCMPNIRCGNIGTRSGHASDECERLCSVLGRSVQRMSGLRRISSTPIPSTMVRCTGPALRRRILIRAAKTRWARVIVGLGVYSVQRPLSVGGRVMWERDERCC